MSKLDVFDSSYYGGTVIAWVCDDGGIGTVLGGSGSSDLRVFLPHGAESEFTRIAKAELKPPQHR